MKLTQIEKFKPGKNVKGFFQLLQMYRRTTKNGDPYLDCLLADQSGRVRAKWWNVPEPAFDWLSPGMVVATTGDVQEYGNELQLIIDQATPAKEGQVEQYGISYEKIVPASHFDIDEMWDTVIEIIQSIENEHLRQLVDQIYRDFEAEVKSHPGSVSHHHLYRGGYLEHIWSLTQLGDLVAEHYYELDHDLFLAGLLLHDIGKVLEIKSDAERQYTDEGQFIGHVVLGRDLVRDTVDAHYPDFPDNLLMQLEHIVLSHQEQLEHGSPKRPATLEALAVAMLDRFDTRMEQFVSTLKDDQNSGDWTYPSRLFPYPLYKGAGEAPE